MSRQLLVLLVLLVGAFAVVKLLLVEAWDAAVVAAIATATFVLDYWWRNDEPD